MINKFQSGTDIQDFSKRSSELMFQVQDSLTTGGDILALLSFSVLLDTNVQFMKRWTWVVKESYIAVSTKSVQSDPWPSS